ncbi:MAG TPA: transcription antitermination factor NusB [Mesorhizobium sp.]|nr:transcription antitermination factor NusB [Mesorhizobium sp.]
MTKGGGQASAPRQAKPPRSAPAEPALPGLPARQAAARLLAAVVDAKTPLDGLTDDAHGHPHYLALEPRDRALCRAILRTALRFRGTIAHLIDARLERPLPPNASALHHVLHIGAAQILFLDVPDHAAVSLAVAQAKADPRARRFSGLVNAVLRGLSREKDSLLPQALAKRLDAPNWFRERLENAYGADKAGKILDMHRHEPPLDLTVRSEPEAWAEKLGAHPLPNGSLRLGRQGTAVPDLPGFSEGAWWVQDAAASFPVRLFGSAAGLRVADLCAAPGGKTAQLAAAGVYVTAVDASRSRLKRLAGNLARLGLSAEIVEADLLTWEPAEKFDAVLLDAPCSSTGTVRRHPDVPWTKGPADVEKLVALQRRLLDWAWRLLKPGGKLVFSNCSLLPEEGEALWREFLAQTPELTPDPIQGDEAPGIDGFVSAEGFLRTTPGDWRFESPSLSGLDGFFAARAVRRP